MPPSTRRKVTKYELTWESSAVDRISISIIKPEKYFSPISSVQHNRLSPIDNFKSSSLNSKVRFCYILLILSVEVVIKLVSVPSTQSPNLYLLFTFQSLKGQ